MSDNQYRAAPLTKKEQAYIQANYRKADAFRGAAALSERYNVPPADIVAVVNYTYNKGRRSNG